MDNPQPEAETPNLMGDHQHVWRLMGGPTFWAECSLCREKLTGDNGPIVGSKAKVEAAAAAAEDALHRRRLAKLREMWPEFRAADPDPGPWDEMNPDVLDMLARRFAPFIDERLGLR